MSMFVASEPRSGLERSPVPAMPMAELMMSKLLVFRPFDRVMLAPLGLLSTGRPLVATAMLRLPQQTVGMKYAAPSPM